MRRRRHGPIVRRTAPRRGFTLVEVVIALTILVSSMLAMGSFIASFSRNVADDTLRSQAVELAANRLEQVKSATVYSTIPATFSGTETNIPLYPRTFTRRTTVRRVGGQPADLDDYTVVTVDVTSPVLRAPVRKTTIISVF